MSTHAQVLRLRRVRRFLANIGIAGMAFSQSGLDRHTEVMISELNGWPAFPLADATPAMLPSPAYGSRPEQLAGFSLQDSFIPDSKPVYPGAFPDTFSEPAFSKPADVAVS
jgi:hypothetical protein